MSILHNFRRELYARELSEIMLLGLAPKAFAKARTKAYMAAGYAPNADNARRDANRPEVKARVSELYAKALEFRDVRPADVVTRIDRVGRANLADLFERVVTSKDDDGREHSEVRMRDLTALPRELSEALASVEWDERGRPKVRMHDKNQANFTLLKYFGGMPDDGGDRRNVNVTNIFAGLSVDDQRTLAEALEALPAGPKSADSEAA